MLSSFAKAIVTLGMIILAFITNALSNVMPLNGQNVGEISNTVFKDVLITPANYAFAIWGVIYLGLLAFGVYQLSPMERHNRRLDALRSLMVAACTAQIIWVLVFLARQYVLSLVAMAAIWIALFLGYLQLTKLQPFQSRQTWSMQIPWSVYLGWISVATIVNVALTLFSLGWSGGFLAPELWTTGLMLVATGLGVIVLWKHRDLAFAGVFIWALIAIAVRHREIPLLLNTGLGSAIVLGMVSLYRGVKPQRRQGV